ncbi:nuclear transport factor 2 family protein, partial [Rhizorhapis sp. SPR117]|uniref:nuclear transport factor 2 family protein n=1 Tax=Rhizorhapis sp. SPR117 TaxID=2912611 RepID=UPI001F42FFF4|nr:nuclear transport factor 2 family protein [Rhizorhapis sp. SPR117]
GIAAVRMRTGDTRMAIVDQTKLQAAIDKQEIHDVLMRYCRGVDRCDIDLLRSVYHPDAIDEHGLFNGSAMEFCEFVIPRQRRYAHSMHSICNVLAEIEGEKAHVESYFIAYIYNKEDDGQFYDTTVGGRYIDRFEKRDGAWKIAHRVVVMDWNRHHPSQAVWDEGMFAALNVRGTKDKTDPVYTRA